MATLSPLGMAEESGDLDLVLPTENNALFSGGGANFYQHIVREYKGRTSYPWEGGQYGFVRDPQESGEGLVYTRFHEGVDIRPVRRDGSGEPLDEVRAIATGKVVHVNLAPGASSYGRYVVIEHRWGGCSYYSLYGHLKSSSVRPGEMVKAAGKIGLLGYTGAGIDRSRAHLHLELNLLLSRNFESWHDHFFKSDPNRHGIYNGINLAGIDIAELYQALRRRPGLTIPQFLSAEPVFYKVRLPASRSFDLPRRYPWMVASDNTDSPASWIVSFSQSGIPLKIEPTDDPVSVPELVYVKQQSGSYAATTRGVIGGARGKARLTQSGERLMRLLIWPD